MVSPRVVFSICRPRRAPADPHPVQRELAAADVGVDADRVVGGGEVAHATSVDQLTRTPPTVLAAVVDAVDLGLVCPSRATPNSLLPDAEIPVIGRSVVGPVTSTPLPPLSSALIPTSVVPRSPRSTRPSAADSRTVTASSRDAGGAVDLEPDAVAQAARCAPASRCCSPRGRPRRGSRVGRHGVPRSLHGGVDGLEPAAAGHHDERPPGPDRQRLAAKPWSNEVDRDPAQAEPAAPGVDRRGVGRRRAAGQPHRLARRRRGSGWSSGLSTIAADRSAVSSVMVSQSLGTNRSSVDSVSAPPERGTCRVSRPLVTRSMDRGRMMIILFGAAVALPGRLGPRAGRGQLGRPGLGRRLGRSCCSAAASWAACCAAACSRACCSLSTVRVRCCRPYRLLVVDGAVRGGRRWPSGRAGSVGQGGRRTASTTASDRGQRGADQRTGARSAGTTVFAIPAPRCLLRPRRRSELSTGNDGRRRPSVDGLTGLRREHSRLNDVAHHHLVRR